MKLLNKYNISVNNSLSVTSYNSKLVHYSIRLIRYKIYYILYYIYKKIYISKLFYTKQFYINLIVCHINLKYINDIDITTRYKNICYNIVKNCYITYNNLFYINNVETGMHVLNNMKHIKYAMLNDNNISNGIINKINNYIYMYKQYNYFLILWLYSIKLLKYVKINVSNIKSPRKK